MRNTLGLVAALLTVGVVAISVSAQTSWMSPLQKPGISLELNKIDMAYPYDFTFWSSQYSLSARFAFSQNLYGLVELPYSHVNYKYGDYWYEPYIVRIDESTVGNPYVGFEIAGRERGPFVRFGARLPLADEDNVYAASFGALSLIDRQEAFVPKLITFSAAFGQVVAEAGKYRASYFVGPTLLVPDEGDAELIADFGAEMWGEGELVRAGIGYRVRYLLTESAFSFSRSMEHQFGISTVANIGSFHPGLHFRFPLDESYSHNLKMIYGLELTIDLPAAD